MLRGYFLVSTVLPEKILRLLSPEDRASLGKAGLTAEEALAKADVKNERTLQGLIVNLLRLKGIEVCWHRTDKKSAATIGWPDITFSVATYAAVPTQPYDLATITACAWEVKHGPGGLSDDQKKMALRLQSPPNFWRWREIRSVDQALAELKEMGIQ